MRAEITDDDAAAIGLALYVALFVVSFAVTVQLLIAGFPWWVAMWGAHSVTYALWDAIRPPSVRQLFGGGADG